MERLSIVKPARAVVFGLIVLAGACAPATPATDIEATVTARVEATVTAMRPTSGPQAGDTARMAAALKLSLAGMCIAPTGRLTLAIDIENASDKEIDGFAGTLVLSDSQGRSVKRFDFAHRERLTAHSKRNDSRDDFQLNPTDPSDNALKAMSVAGLRLTFEPRLISFSDGTQLGSP